MAEAFNMRVWLEGFIGSAPYNELIKYRLGNAQGHAQVALQPLEKHSDIFKAEFSKGMAAALTVDEFKELLDELKRKQDES